jgi:hypothetical protein
MAAAMMRVLLTISLFALSACPRVARAEEESNDTRFFRERIEPVLHKHCFQCHSAKADSVKGGLRLDTSSLLRRGGESGAVIVAGNPGKSLLLSALKYDGLEMPPDKKLPQQILADFEKWILAGAVDPRGDSDNAKQHWAFQPIRRPVPPQVDSAWPRNEIDQFILARLHRKKVNPSPDAERATLLRRLYLDLTGLPPTPADVAAFLSNSKQTAYEEVVDRLLASPHYGERWGRHWLDMARYADSNGYEADRPRPHAWRWRDWVINVLNNDMPFDQFTIEQLAGDLLPKPTLEQLVATGFHRNTLVNTEGGVDREEDRVKRTVDRTNTLGKVWLGLTLGCSHCHSHKYDLISQHEYFSMYAFFNNLSEPDIPVPTQDELAQHELKMLTFEQDHQKYLDAIASYRSAGLSKWEASLPTNDVVWTILNPDSLDVKMTNMSLTLEDDLSVFAAGENDRQATYTIVARTSLNNVTAVRLEVFADERIPKGGPGLASNGNFVLTSLRVYVKPTSDTDPESKGQYIPLKTARADFSQGNRQVTSVLGDDPTDGWAIYPQVDKDHTAVFELSKDIRRGKNEGDELIVTIELDHQLEQYHNIGRFRLALTNADRPIPDELPEIALTDVLKTPPDKRTGRDMLRLFRFYDYHEKELDRLISAEAEHRQQQPKPMETTIKAQTIAESRGRRDTRVHERGDFLSQGDLVQPGTPGVFPPLNARGKMPDRLDLAHWLVGDTNPLTARVTVNRVWQQYFGRGLVATGDDFGTQGDRPSHPQLLDWLANRFREDGWSLKKLHKLIVTSATYRQSSHVRPELLERDPYNTWLARQHRLRVEAEIVRDLALSVSGLLNPEIGGRSVRPPQPADLASLGFQGNVKWPVSKGRDRYRRGLYTFFQRTVPYPMLVDFDAPDSNTSCTRRERSMSPLQALTLWNDPVFVECAQALGRRIIAESPTSQSTDRLRYAVRLTMSREAKAPELKTLALYYQKQKERFGVNSDVAKSFVGEGQVPNHSTHAELAAWVSVARLLTNLDEFITRE